VQRDLEPEEPDPRGQQDRRDPEGTAPTETRCTGFSDGEACQRQDAGSKALELIGGVQARVAGSFLLTTDYAYYDHERQRISSSAGVHVEGPELLLDGAEWEYMIAEQRGKVDGGVKAKLIFTPRLTSR
jgi:hypothetical protein